MLPVVALLLVVAVSADKRSNAPKILSVTLSPPGPVMPGTEVNATALIYSPLDEPQCIWTLQKYGSQEKSLRYELIVLPDNKTYESRVSFGRIRLWNQAFLDVSNSYGKEMKRINFSLGKRFGEPCETSAECLLVSSNSECEPNEERCRCEPGYGVYGINFEEKDQTCKKFPIRQVKTMEIGKSIDMACRINVDNLSEINWYRNGIICKRGSSYCSQNDDTTYYEEIFSSQQRLWLHNVMTSATYTCKATTTDGRSWTVSETEIVVVPQLNSTRYVVSGSDYDWVFCGHDWTRLEILVRDGKDVCTPSATWCSMRNSTTGDRQWYDVLNLRANHTFTCEAVLDDEKTATVSVFNFIVGEIPKILGMTFSPNGTEVVATARFLSLSGEPRHQWKLSYHGREQPGLEANLTLVSENEYESRVSLGPIRPGNSISFEVSNAFGKDKRDSNILVGKEEGRQV